MKFKVGTRNTNGEIVDLALPQHLVNGSGARQLAVSDHLRYFTNRET